MEEISPLLTDLYQLNMIQAYLDHGDHRDRRLRIVRPHAAGAARIPARRRPRTGARLSGKPALLGRRDRLAEEHRPLRQKPSRLSSRLPLHRRRPRHARRHGVLRQRADPAADRAAAAGAIRRIAPHQHPALSRSLVAAKAARSRAGRARTNCWSISACGARTAPKPA